MQIVVEVTSIARESLVRLLEDRTSQAPDALVAAVVYTEDIIRTFETHGAPPPGATVHRYSNRDGLWWNYADGVWMKFTLEVRATRFSFRTEKLIKVLVFAEQPIAP